MITSTDLLDLAKAGVVAGAKPAALSRSISTLYYALFHAVIETARARLCPSPAGPELRRRFSASFDHLKMAEVANQIQASENPSRRGKLKSGIARWTEVLPQDPAHSDRKKPSRDLLDFCGTFTKMQQLRHHADYHVDWSMPLTEAQQHLAESELGLAAWRRIEMTEEALVFLLACLEAITYR